MAEKITAFMMTLLIPLYMLLTFPLLALAVRRVPDLADRLDLPRPQNVVLFSVLALTKVKARFKISMDA